MIKKIVTMTAIILILTGCSFIPINEQAELTIVDALDREVAFSVLPERIVIAGKQTPMLANFAYFFHENADNIIAIENRSQSTDQFLQLLDDSIDEKLILEKNAGVEQIAPLEPDLVILKTVMKEQIGDQIESVGIPVIYVSFETIDEIYTDLINMGKLFGDEEKANEIVSFYKAKKFEIDDMIADEETKEKMLLVQISSADSGFNYSVPSASWLQTTMVTDLLGSAVWVDEAAGGGWTEVNAEQIIAWEPEKTMVINYQGEAPQVIDALRSDPVWEKFLLENGAEIFPFPYDFLSWDQPDPRWILGYASIAHRQYIDVVSSEFLVNLIGEFYSNLFGLDNSLISDQIINRVSDQF